MGHSSHTRCEHAGRHWHQGFDLPTDGRSKVKDSKMMMSAPRKNEERKEEKKGETKNEDQKERKNEEDLATREKAATVLLMLVIAASLTMSQAQGENDENQGPGWSFEAMMMMYTMDHSRHCPHFGVLVAGEGRSTMPEVPFSKKKRKIHRHGKSSHRPRITRKSQRTQVERRRKK